MVYRDKRDRLYEDLGSRGIKKSRITLPLPRPLVRLGVPVTPPYYWVPVALFAVSAVLSALPYGTLNWLLSWRSGTRACGRIALNVSFVSGVFGLAVSLISRRQAKSLKLPCWRDYPEG